MKSDINDIDAREPVISNRLFLILILLFLFAFPFGFGATKAISFLSEKVQELIEPEFQCGQRSQAQKMGPFKAGDPNRPAIVDGCWDKFGNGARGAKGADAK